MNAAVTTLLLLSLVSPSLSSAPACGSPVVSGRIVGGADAVHGKWPWQAAVEYRATYFICGGSLINERWVLSAAHCFEDDPTPSRYSVYLGLYQLSIYSPEGKRSSVENIIINSQYNSKTMRADIALLKMTSPFTYSNYILPICLPAASVSFPAGMECWATGWGDLNSDVSLPLPYTLQEVKLPLIDYKQCDNLYHIGSLVSSSITIIYRDQICAGHAEGGKDACQGDSGGPLVCKVDSVWIQAGVVSWGDECAKRNRPGVYTLVPAFQSWIKTYVPELTFSTSDPGSGGDMTHVWTAWKVPLYCVLLFIHIYHFL
uniref:Peptidase S1 domain-containing protein n=1 Tax=Leptobrachium leishanense TaxID=445787 RepID=A0A8C5LSH1_9ANUR